MGSEDKCDFCHTGEDTVSICGTLHKDMHDGKTLAAHHKCMQYSAMLVQYKTDEFGGFKKKDVIKEVKRGQRLACFLCKMNKNRKKGDVKGATSGCALASCRKTFHYYCVSMNNKTVAKRYKVSAGNKEVILYRVFCSKLHEEHYRDNISAEDIAGQQSSGEENDDDDDDDDKEEESSKSSSDTEENYMYAGKRGREIDSDTDVIYRRKRTRKGEGDVEEEEASCSMYGMPSPEMTGEEVVLETQRQYQELLEKQRNMERSASRKKGKNGNSAGISIETDSGENVTEDFNTSNGPSPDDTDLSETESMLNSTQQGPLILIPSKLEVADLKTICKKADLPAESVLLWPSSYRGLKDKHMPFIMWEIANRVRKGSQDSLIQLLSDSPSPEYDSVRALLSSGDLDIIDEIKKLVNDVNIKYNCEVFRLLRVPLDDIDLKVLVLTLPNELLDRFDLVTNFAVCQWTHKTVLSFCNNRIIDFTLERKLLLKWITHRLGTQYELFVYPKEDTFKSQRKSVSIARSIVSKLKSTSQTLFSDCPVKVLVVQKVDRKVTKFKAYIHKLVESFVLQHPGFECFCVVDILPGDDIREISDIVPENLSEYSVQVYSALCPTYNQISCVVLHVDRDVRYEGRVNGHRAGHHLSRKVSNPSVYIDVAEQSIMK